jgi:hypothetical protein
MLVFNKYFCNNKKSYLCFGDRVATINDFQKKTCFVGTKGVVVESQLINCLCMV